ncbi:MAG: hypothetical protein ACKOW8_01880 [Flavobacteriales bacterium]
MRFFFTALIILSQFLSLCAQPDNIRQSYLNARTPDGIKSFLSLSEKLNLYVAAEKGYRGVALAMYADVADGVSTKLEYFNRGKDLIEAAIKEQPGNAEIRFLRLTVQAEAPFMLGYSRAINEDVEAVLKAFTSGHIQRSHFFWSAALRYIMGCDEISEEKRNQFKKFSS